MLQLPQMTLNYVKKKKNKETRGKGRKDRQKHGEL